MNIPSKYLATMLAAGSVVAGVFSFGGIALADSDFATTSARAMHRDDFRSATSTRNPAGMMRGWAKHGEESSGGSAQSPLIRGNGQPIVGGTVAAINGNMLTVTNKSNVTYSVDATNATIKKGMATSTLASMTVGDNVIVQGTVNGTSVSASSIIDQGIKPAENGEASTTPSEHRGGGILNAVKGFFSRLFGFF